MAARPYPIYFLRVDKSYLAMTHRELKEGRYPQDANEIATYGISADAVTANDEVVRYLGDERPDSLYEIVKFALTDKAGNFTYFVLKLQSDYNFVFNGMLLLLSVFSLFIIYTGKAQFCR